MGLSVPESAERVLHLQRATETAGGALSGPGSSHFTAVAVAQGSGDAEQLRLGCVPEGQEARRRVPKAPVLMAIPPRLRLS